jgi:glucarate dehydratase
VQLDGLSCGVRRREDTVYLRSIQPDFQVNTARW